MKDADKDYNAVRIEMDRQGRAVVIRRDYPEIQEEPHGLDYKAQAILAGSRAQREAVLVEAEAGGAGQGTARFTDRALPSAPRSALA